MTDDPFEMLTIGRAGVDLYPAKIGYPCRKWSPSMSSSAGVRQTWPSQRHATAISCAAGRLLGRRVGAQYKVVR